MIWITLLFAMPVPARATLSDLQQFTKNGGKFDDNLPDKYTVSQSELAYLTRKGNNGVYSEDGTTHEDGTPAFGDSDPDPNHAKSKKLKTFHDAYIAIKGAAIRMSDKIFANADVNHQTNPALDVLKGDHSTSPQGTFVAGKIKYFEDLNSQKGTDVPKTPEPRDLRV
eukprot:NODE_1108_length_2181_cov_0.661864.p2 type:complete len:168 gc:universal NODE_1108_length_2181_cov_0.661864:478-981(+)